MSALHKHYGFKKQDRYLKKKKMGKQSQNQKVRKSASNM